MLENEITINVDAADRRGKLDPVWSYFGYDEPNYTYAPGGKKLLKELAALSGAPVYVRTHNLLTSGDGTPSLKWGSTGVYSEDGSGHPVYDWTIIDRIFDAYHESGIRPLVEIGFMPEALSTHPQPYRHHWPEGNLWTGWAYPPKDYARWSELIYNWASHVVNRYGRPEVETWLWEVWNEPDIGYWQGTPDEYCRLHDYSAAAVRRALPGAIIGGPHTTGGGGEYLRGFLNHCSRGTNAATGGTGSPLDYIAFHPKGSTRFVDGHIRMSLGNHLKNVDRNLEVIASLPEWRSMPIVLGESDPEGCAACAAVTYPENGYRNGPMYAAYTAAALAGTLELAEKYGVSIRGIVTWAFEFEDQPYFAGFRSLSTNGIAKPILNLFRMLGRMGAERVALESSGATTADLVAVESVREQAVVDGIAALDDRRLTVLIWRYHDDDIPIPDASIAFSVVHLPARVAHLRHFRIDQTHSNAFRTWRELGSRDTPTAEEYAKLEAAGQLQRIDERRIPVENGRLEIRFPLPLHGVSLLELSWPLP